MTTTAKRRTGVVLSAAALRLVSAVLVAVGVGVVLAAAAAAVVVAVAVVFRRHLVVRHRAA